MRRRAGASSAQSGVVADTHNNGEPLVQIRVLHAALFALGSSAATLRAGAQATPASTGFPVTAPQVVTSATGEAHFTPDRAAIYVGVQTRAATAVSAGRDNAQRQKAIIDAIVGLGIGRDQVSTQNYSVYPETRYDTNGQRPIVTGYVVSNVVRVELKRIDQVGSVIDGALSKGANQINSLEFFASNPDSARREALADAVAKARGDAEAMARAAGGALGALAELSSADVGPRPIFRMEAVASQKTMAPTPIEVGEQIVRVSVTARWYIIQPK